MASRLDVASSSCNVQDSTVTMPMPSTCSHGNTIHEDNTRQSSTPLPDCHNSRTPMQHLVPELNVSSLDTSGSSVTMDTDSVSIATLSISSDVEREELEPGHISVPILGYEVMEERSRFSVFKIQVSRGPDDVWFIFRRYSDFDHLNKQLKEVFPHFRLALPPKKWFGDNYDKNFLEDRMIGLQAFLNNLVGNRDVCNSQPVREFFCFDEPPGPHDSLEESRALCENLEEHVFSLHQQVTERDRRIMLLEDELRLSQLQVENLRKALNMEKAAAKRNSLSSLPSMEEITEIDELQAAGDKDSERSETYESSVCMTDSLKTMETIRLAPVTEQQEAELVNKVKVIPKIRENSTADYGHSRDGSAATSDLKSGHQHLSDNPIMKASHQGTLCNSTDVASTLRYAASDMTGPGQLCLSSNELVPPSSRISTLASPQPKLETLMTSGGQEMTSPGAHSVDSSSKKHTMASGACDIQSRNNDACNNNEAVLI